MERRCIFIKKRQITYDEFLSYTQIKPGLVHIHQGLIYKHSPNSLEIVSAIEETKANPVFRYISTPKSILMIEDFYFGYTSKFRTDLHIVEDAEYLRIVKDINDFIWKLLHIIEELNKLNFYYWDYHQNNIFSDLRGNPFIIDIDDMNTSYSELNLYHQAKYLTEYLLNILFSQEKPIQKYAKSEILEKYLSTESMNYIRSLLKRTGANTNLPYILIEELSNPYKREVIKSKIK